MNKPKVFNYKKAMREKEELQGELIRANVELQHYRNMNTPIEAEKDDFYRCPKCGNVLCRDERVKELMLQENLMNFCSKCGQRITLRLKDGNS